MAKKRSYKLSVYSARGKLVLARSKKEASKLSGESSPYISETGLSKFKGKIVPCRYLPKHFGSNSWGMCAKGDEHKIVGGWRSKEAVAKDIQKLGKDKIVGDRY